MITMYLTDAACSFCRFPALGFLALFVCRLQTIAFVITLKAFHFPVIHFSVIRQTYGCIFKIFYETGFTGNTFNWPQPFWEENIFKQLNVH